MSTDYSFLLSDEQTIDDMFADALPLKDPTGVDCYGRPIIQDLGQLQVVFDEEYDPLAESVKCNMDAIIGPYLRSRRRQTGVKLLGVLAGIGAAGWGGYELGSAFNDAVHLADPAVRGLSDAAAMYLCAKITVPAGASLGRIAGKCVGYH